MRYKGNVKVTIDGREYLLHNSGTDFLFHKILNYLKGQDESVGGPAEEVEVHGILKHFDIGYENGDWESLLLSKVGIKAARFKESTNTSKTLILEGEVLPSNIADLSDVDLSSVGDFYIRMYDNSDNYLAQVRVSEELQDYLENRLSTTVQIIIGWELSFDNVN